MVRQGDVLLIPARPEAVTAAHVEVARRNGALVLADGELTGHQHAIYDESARLLRVEGDLDAVLVAPERCLLVHPEHDAIAIAKGTYIVRRQREYVDEDHFEIVAD